ncbi:hypothetical protein NL676_020289 [Syzygium grande]|nr:hypothetical protein NL676_020289 [Syzygium grande]
MFGEKHTGNRCSLADSRPCFRHDFDMPLGLVRIAPNFCSARRAQHAVPRKYSRRPVRRPPLPASLAVGPSDASVIARSRSAPSLLCPNQAGKLLLVHPSKATTPQRAVIGALSIHRRPNDYKERSPDPVAITVNQLTTASDEVYLDLVST